MPTASELQRGEIPSAVLRVDGYAFDFWEEYQFSSDLLDPCNEFHFRAPVLSQQFASKRDFDQRGLSMGQPISLHINTPNGTTLQHTGRIHDVSYEFSRDGGAHIVVTGRDHMASLVDGCILPSVSMESVSFADVVKKTIGPLGYEMDNVVIGNDANRLLLTGKAAAGTTLSKDAPTALEALKVDQAKPHAGETAYAFLDRHAKRFGLLIWGTGDGKIVIGRPNYDQRPLYRFWLRPGDAGLHNNAMGGRRRLSVRHRPSEVHVYGKSWGHDFTRSPVHAVVTDDEVVGKGFVRPLVIHDNNARTKAEAERRAKQEISKRKQTGDVVSLVVPYHFDDAGSVYAIDTVADVQIDQAGQNGPMYMIHRTFSKSRAGGTSTQIELVPLHSIELD